MNDFYSIHPLVKIHNASDQSGILLYSGFTGHTIQLSCQFQSLLTLLQSQSSVQKSQIMQILRDIDSDQSDDVWHTLTTHFILCMEPTIEA